MEHFMYVFLQFSWGILQNLIGLGMYLYYRRNDPDLRRERFHHAYMIHWNRRDSMAMGMFIFFGHGEGAERMKKHEYGHTKQSILLGPLYLLVIGIPSFIWANSKSLSDLWRSGKYSYFDLYTERWADAWGGVKKRCDFHGNEI